MVTAALPSAMARQWLRRSFCLRPECQLTGEHPKRGWVEFDAAAGVVGLAPGFVELVADCDQAAVDRQAGVVDVEVGPFQAEQFAAAKPGVG